MVNELVLRTDDDEETLLLAKEVDDVDEVDVTEVEERMEDAEELRECCVRKLVTEDVGRW